MNDLNPELNENNPIPGPQDQEYTLALESEQRQTALFTKFEAIFGHQAQFLVSSPGRVNLIGYSY